MPNSWMKKVLVCPLIVGVLILSGLGTVAIQDADKNTTTPLLISQPEIEAEFWGGSGITVAFTNLGDDPIKAGQFALVVIIDPAIMMMVKQLIQLLNMEFIMKK